MAKKGGGMEIAEFFTRLGFKIDDKELKKYERSLNNLKEVAKAYKRVSDSIKGSSGTKAAMDALKIEQQKTKLQKEQVDLEAKQLRLTEQTAKAKERQNRKATSAQGGTRTPNNLRGFMGNSETVIRLRQDLESLGKTYKNVFGVDSGVKEEIAQLHRLSDAFKKGQIKLDDYKEAMVRWKRQSRESISLLKKNINEHKKLNFVLQRSINSAKQYVATYASMYAVAAVGQDAFMKAKEIEGVEAAMLGAADSMELATDRIRFLRKESERIGIDFLGISRDFTQLTFAAKGKMSEDQIRELFTGMSQFGTTMKMDSEQMKRSFKAVNQMLNKGQVMA